MRPVDLRPISHALLAALALAYAVHAVVPRASLPLQLPAARPLWMDLALGALLGLAMGAAFTLWRSRRRRPIRNERDLLAVIGDPLLAARPMRREALRALARQLLEHWFDGTHTLLPVVSARAGDGRSSLAAELALVFAEMGERTLLVDADFRAPGLHRRFSLPNRKGLADLLDGRDVRLAACRENLAVLVAGRVREDPLELLSRARLKNFLDAAARPFRVVLIDTPPAERGPDHEIFSALAGGALLVVRPGDDAAGLARVRRRLRRCAARPVCTVFNDS
ncbi:MAG TPA: CpsD/CapB family tyrosine-protein kinase [Ideonella sp.]|nr:CpsD/CapB family tyrosine-protein kinase [Ideonella sp.]